MENLESKINTMKLVRDLPVAAQCEFLQLTNGLRKVAEICVMPEFREKFFRVVDKLKDAGYSVAQKEKDGGITNVFVSLEPDLAEEAAGLSKEDTDYAKRYGELMGFPSSAVEAFVSGKSNLVNQKEEKEILGFENIFFPFRLSKKHYTDEIEHLKKSYKLLLDQAPYLIDETFSDKNYIKEFKEAVNNFLK